MVATQDVEMEVENVEKDPETEQKDKDLLAVQEIREHAKQIDKAVASKEPRFILRVLRSLPNTRGKLNPNVLRTLATQLYPIGAERDAILVYLEESTADPEVTRPRAAVKSPLPEVDAYFHLLALVRLLDAGLLEKASGCGELMVLASHFTNLIFKFSSSSTTDVENHVTESSLTGFSRRQELFLSFSRR